MRRSTILLVEDNPDDVDLCIRALKRGRLANDIVVARDGVEALERLGLRPRATTEVVLPALVLLDLKLPRIDGLEVLQEMRAHDETRLLPVVILTTSQEERDIVRGYALGANSYVVKPVDAAQFEAAIHELQMYWLVINRPPPAEAP